MSIALASSKVWGKSDHGGTVMPPADVAPALVRWCAGALVKRLAAERAVQQPAGTAGTAGVAAGL